MAVSPTKSVEVDADLLGRVQQVANERGVAVPQFVQEALEHELAEDQQEPNGFQLPLDEGEQPPVTCIGMFSSGRGDLSKLASEDVFEPRPSR